MCRFSGLPSYQAMLKRFTFLLASASLSGLAVSVRAQDAMQFPQKETNYQVPQYQGHLDADDFQWLRPAKDYASTRYSTLDQINAGNARNLQVAFTFSTGL
jgi:glucose dehydrogenase